MLKLTEQQHGIITAVRDSFPHTSMYLGGSTAISGAFPQIIAQDLDIFVIGPRSLCSWAQRAVLREWTDTVQETEFYRSKVEGKYLIPGQQKFWRLTKDNIQIDVICLKEGTDIFKTFSCDLSTMVHTIDYRVNAISTVIMPDSVRTRLFRYKEAYINLDNSTDAYVKKCEARAKLLGIKLIRT